MAATRAIAAPPPATAFGEDAYRGIWLKAAALMESLGRNRSLVDGNKRLAWTGTWFFLGINGHPLDEPLDDDAAEKFVIDVVTGALDVGSHRGDLALLQGLRPPADHRAEARKTPIAVATAIGIDASRPNP